MSVMDNSTAIAEQISALNLNEELTTSISGTTWVVRREDGRSSRLTRMDGCLIDAVVEMSNVRAAEAAATMLALSARGWS